MLKENIKGFLILDMVECSTLSLLEFIKYKNTMKIYYLNKFHSVFFSRNLFK